MDEEFGSFVVTDPDIVDPSIDVSGLRTQTDTSLLGNIPDFAGIQYEAFNPTRLTDLMRLYSSGLPAINTSQPVTPAPPGGGGGGGGTSPGTGTITPPQPDSIGGFDPGVTPGPSGFIGLDPDMDIDPRDIDDYGTYTPPTTPADTSIMVEDLTQPSNIGDFQITGAPALTNQSGLIDSAPIIGDFVNPTTVEGPLSKVRPPGFPQDYSVTGALGVDPLEKDDVLSGADVANPKGFLAKMGLEQFDPAEAFVKTAFNLAVGKPVTLFIDILKDLLPPQDPRVGALKELYPDRTSAGTIASGLMTGYNPVSGGLLNMITGGKYGEPTTYGLQEAYQDRIDTVENTLQDKYGLSAKDIADIKAGTFNPEKMDVQTDLVQRLIDLENAKAAEKKRLDIFEGDIDDRDRMLEDLSTDSLQGKINLGIQAADDDKGSDMLDTATGVNPFAGIDTGVGEFDTTPVTGITRPGTGTVLGKPGIERFDDAEASIDMFDTTPIDTTVTGTLGPPSEISGPQVTEKKSVDKKSADDKAVEELSYDQVIEYQNLSDQLIGQEIQKTGNPDISMIKQEEIKNKAIDQIKEKDLDEFSDEEFMVGDTSTAAPIGGDSGADSFFDAVDKSVTGTTKPGTKTEPTYQDAIMRGQTGGGSDSGGSSNGGGKIVCTMMNESYGFGSFRNKIWMKFHKDLSPEYQRGYHKLFLPLVRIAKKNIIVKKVLEHIAVHSTIDMRQSMRGKTHLLGRVYRKILLPLCYWVGKNG